jgi:uncharacterized integral membrane protein
MLQTQPTTEGGTAAAPPPATSASSAAPIGAQRTRTGIVWWALGFSMVLLVITMVFVLQNLGTVSISFFTVRWAIPLGLDLLLAALLGGLITFGLGVARILQLRRLAHRTARAQRRAGGAL